MSDAQQVQVKTSYRDRFTASLETRLLYERLRKMVVGETVTYRELTGIIGQDTQRGGRSALRSARHIAQRDNQIVLDAIQNVGLRRLSDRETVATAGQALNKVRRTAQRGIDRLTAVSDFDALPDADKAQHNASISALAVVKLMAKPKSVDRIAGAVNTTNTGQLPVARTLELFRGPRV
jgi:hypothetical protein